MKKPDFQIDFYSDWIGILRKRLAADGIEVSMDEDPEEIEVLYFNVRRRRIPARPREILVAKEFGCPPEHSAAFELICAKVRRGEDLTPYQTSKVKTRPQAKDGLLFDWDIHHFHLGVKLEPCGFVERTTDLLFARVTPRHFFALTVGQHGDWGKIKLLDIIHRNWPESIAQWRTDWIGPFPGGEPLAPTEIVGARAAGLQLCVALPDGTEYISPGGGIVTTGESLDVISSMQHYRRRVHVLEQHTRKNMPKLVALAKKRGWRHRSVLHVRLEIRAGVAFAVVDDLSIEVKIGTLI